MTAKNLRDLVIYQEAVALSNQAWEIYNRIPNTIKMHIGNQFVDAVDSIGANIAEGFGRYHYRDSIRFYIYARGSLFEVKHWIYLLHKRNIVNSDQYSVFNDALEKEGVRLNNFIKKTRGLSTGAREDNP